MATAEVGVFGGSGFYSFLENAEEIDVDTPYGKPSAQITIASSLAIWRCIAPAPFDLLDGPHRVGLHF